MNSETFSKKTKKKLLEEYLNFVIKRPIAYTWIFCQGHSHTRTHCDCKDDTAAADASKDVIEKVRVGGVIEIILHRKIKQNIHLKQSLNINTMTIMNKYRIKSVLTIERVNE